MDLAGLHARWRRTGADLPGGDPRCSHGAEMEGYFWRLTHAEQGVVALALCGINRHPDGPWATVAVAAHPAGVVRSAAVPADVADDPDRLAVRAGDVLAADEHGVRVQLDDVVLDATVPPEPWPLRLPGGGVVGTVPFLGQYWHPHVLAAAAGGTLRVGERSWDLAGAVGYAEKNWGRGFPERWWWGQANTFDQPKVAVAFGGGLLAAGPVRTEVTGIVVRVGARTLRLAPPLARVRCCLGDDTWTVRGRTRRTEVQIDGAGAGTPPAVLPVPLPAERRNVDTDLEHLAGSMRVRVVHDGRTIADARSDLAALEVGSRPT